MRCSTGLASVALDAGCWMLSQQPGAAAATASAACACLLRTLLRSLLSSEGLTCGRRQS